MLKTVAAPAPQPDREPVLGGMQSRFCAVVEAHLRDDLVADAHAADWDVLLDLLVFTA